MLAGNKPVAAAQDPVRPVIRKIVVDDPHRGHHGGAWKIALADMMTALMAFFLLMWLLGASSEDKKKSVADYFRPASHSQIRFGELAGSNGLLGGRSIINPEEGFPFDARQTGLLERLTPQSEAGPDEKDGSSSEPRNREGPAGEPPDAPDASDPRQATDRQTFDKLEQELMQKISENRQLRDINEQVAMIREKEGLRIEIIDKSDFSMFRLGTAEFDGRAVALITQVAQSLHGTPNRIAIRGHTDSLGFAPDSLRNNWTLSTERADATRQLMQKSGIESARFARIEGVADTDPFLPENPADARNRRISITVLNQ